MADIEVAPLSDRLAEGEIHDLANALERAGVPSLPHADESGAAALGEGIDEETLGEMMDRLEAHDLACHIYLPIEFDFRIDAGERRIGSAHALLEALEDLKEELAIDEDEDEDEDDEDSDEDDGEDDDLLLRELRRCWQALYAGAQTAVERHLPLHVQS